MLIHSVPIPEEMVLLAQRVFYEYQALKNLMISILSLQEFKPNPELYDKVKREYMDKEKEFNLIMEELRSTYAPQFNSNHSVKISVSFINGTLDVIDGSGCICE